MPITTRQRDLVIASNRFFHYLRSSGPRKQEFNGNVVTNHRGTQLWLARQITVSEGHPWPSKRRSGEDIGGDFFTSKSQLELSYEDPHGFPHLPAVRWHVQSLFSSAEEVYEGPVLPIDPTVAMSSASSTGPSSDAELDALGTTAIARCSPTNSMVDLSTALGELAREGIPSLLGAQLWKTRLKDHRAIGGEYLNVQFGWLPLVSEIQDLAKTVQKADAIIAQYERDSGKIVRRRYEFPDESSSVTTELINLRTATVFGHRPWTPGREMSRTWYKDGLEPTMSTLTRHRSVTKKRWFTGAFTYYLPTEINSRKTVGRTASEMRKLYGLEITPETLWNLTPWSWAVDWASNAGDVIHNVSMFAQDGLVLRWGYMMETSIITDTYTLSNHNLSRDARPISLSFTTTVKKRRKATPFGFGLNQDGFTTRQWSILAALGISKTGRKP